MIPLLALLSIFYYVDAPDAWESLNRHLDQISILAPEGYHLDADGLIWGSIDPRIVPLAKNHRIKVMPLVVNTGFDQGIIHAVLSDPEKRKRATERMLLLCLEKGYEGLQFDFENVHFTHRETLNTFFKDTADAFHARGLILTIAVVHKYTEDAGGSEYHRWLYENWRGAYDYEFLGKHADFVSIMSYAQHTRRTPPGPGAAIPWVRKIIEFTLQRIPKEKVSLGIPLGARHWLARATDQDGYTTAAGGGYEFAMDLARRHGRAIQWDDEDQVPWFSFYEDGIRQYVYFEDMRSFRAKLELMKAYGLTSFSAWRLGYEDPASWEELKKF